MMPANRNTTTSDRLTTVLSYGALVLMGYLVFRISEPFLRPLAWSAVFAIFLHPVYDKLEKRISPTSAALLCTVGVAVLMIVPVLLIMLHAAREAIDASMWVQRMVSDGTLVPSNWLAWIRSELPDSLQNIDLVGPLRQGAERLASYIGASVAFLLKNLFTFVVNLFILLFALFFMFRDGHRFLQGLRHLIPFERELQDDMLNESRDLIFASVAVMILVAAIQGTLGALAFQVTGLAAPVFMALLIAFFSIVPVVGSALIWVPAALWLALHGHWGKATAVVAICGGVAGLVDNFVRPLLLRNRTKLNDLLLFISILGGLEVFGLLGLVAGPTILAAALGVFRVYVEHRERLETMPVQSAR